MFKWTNQPPVSAAVQKSIEIGVRQRDRGTLVVVFFFFSCLTDVIQKLKFPSICPSRSNLQPTVTDNNVFTEVMRLIRGEDVHLEDFSLF